VIISHHIPPFANRLQTDAKKCFAAEAILIIIKDIEVKHILQSPKTDPYPQIALICYLPASLFLYFYHNSADIRTLVTSTSVPVGCPNKRTLDVDDEFTRVETITLLAIVVNA
jgi:hypothetical protein